MCVEVENEIVPILEADGYRVETGKMVRVNNKYQNMYIVINGKTKLLSLDIFCLNQDLITEYSTKDFKGFAIFNNYLDDGVSTILIVKVSPELEDPVILMDEYELTKDFLFKEVKTFKYKKKSGVFSLGRKTFTLHNLNKKIRNEK